MKKLILILMIVGGLNWGLIGILKFNLVAALLGDMTILARIIYGLVGLSSLYGITFLFENNQRE